MDVPILLFLGAWWLFFGWDLAGRDGLIFPGAAGLILWLIAAVRVLIAKVRARPLASSPISPRMMRLTWAGCFAAFLLAVAIEIFIGRLMPAPWKDAVTTTLHIRTTHRNYGASP